MLDISVHNELKRKNKIFAFSASVFAIIVTAARMIITRFYIHEEAHYYTEKANSLVFSADYIIAVGVILIYFFSLFIYKRKRESHDYKESAERLIQGTQPQVFSSFLAGFLFIANSIFQAYSLLNPPNKAETQKNPDFFGWLANYIKEFPFDFFIFFAAILSAVYFFKTAALNFDAGETPPEAEGSKNGAKYAPSHVIFSFMPIMWCFLNIFKCFFDMSRNVHSHIRIYELMSFLAILAYFVSESRILVGRRETARFFTYSYISMIVVSASSLPNLAWSSFWILSTNSDQILYATQLAIVMYVFSRVYSQIRYGRFFLCR
ncbi:MAG: hypothetical protein FWG34_01125 [Oscillospiraceae bacterium]|nr:hypothetical protein [Oscillospiraceae bacterium]